MKTQEIKITAAVVLAAAVLCAAPAVPAAENSESVAELVRARMQQEYSSLFELYKHFHSHPELSFQEVQTSARLAAELRQAGFEVTAGVGKHGVVAVLRNGTGPTVLVRSDMDALPVKEQTGLPYASQVTTHDALSNEVPVMHACGHDIHMTCLVGVARVLRPITNQWRGTLILIGQPAEEAVGGARAMLTDGLFTRFPRPDFCLALHDDAELATGTIGYTPGYAMANVDSVDILIHGVGGHGAYPHKTRDPIVLAAQIILGLQTIVSREIQPTEPAVVTVGSIHGGTKHNIIPDEVRLQLTVRSYTDEVRQQTLAAIRRIVRGQALAAGIPEDRLPEVKLGDDFTPATYNDPALTSRIVAVFKKLLGGKNLIEKKPSMGGEDFSEYGRVEPRIPIFMFHIGSVRPAAVEESKRTGTALPSLHSPLWAPVPQPTIETGIAAMTAAVLELMQPQAR
jgi:hippurate hydrolase